MTGDHADAIATAILGILAGWLHDPVLHNEITAQLREEIEDLRRQLLSDIRGTPD